MKQWTDKDRVRFAGVLGRSADHVQTRRRIQRNNQAALSFVKPLYQDVMRRSDHDLPTGAKELVTGAMASLTIKD